MNQFHIHLLCQSLGQKGKQFSCSLLFSEMSMTVTQAVCAPVPTPSSAPVQGGPTVMDIDRVKYVYVMKPSGESELIPVPVPQTNNATQTSCC